MPEVLLNLVPLNTEGAGNAGRSTRPQPRVQMKKAPRVSHHGHTGDIRHSPRNGFNGFLRGLPGDRAFLPPSPPRCRRVGPKGPTSPQHHRPVDTSVGVSGRHDFAVRETRIRLVRHRVHRISCPTFCDDRETPLRRAGDARKTARDLPVVTSEKVCGTLARRANQAEPSSLRKQGPIRRGLS